MMPKRGNEIFLGSRGQINGKNKLINQIEISAAITRLKVTNA